MLLLVFSIIILCMVPGYKTMQTSGKRTGIRVLSIINIILAVINIFSMLGLLVMLCMRGFFDNILAEITHELISDGDLAAASMMQDVIDMIFDMAPVLMIITLALTVFALVTGIYGLKATKAPLAPTGMVYQQPGAYYGAPQNNAYNPQNGAPVQPVQPVQQAAPSDYQWYCSNCGRMNPESVNFCPSCGSARPQQQTNSHNGKKE